MTDTKIIIPDINFFMGGYFSPNAWIQSRGGVLRILFCDMPFGEPDLFGDPKDIHIYHIERQIEEVKPKEEQWKTFLEVLKITDAWEKEYVEHICDGTQWSLDVYFKLPEGKRKLKRVYGSNEYPEDFDKFAKALAKLIQFSQLQNPEKFEFINP